jgi:hypothetical protein
MGFNSGLKGLKKRGSDNKLANQLLCSLPTPLTLHPITNTLFCFRDLTGGSFPVLNAQIMAVLPDVESL